MGSTVISEDDTTQLQHDWVMYTITPVEVFVKPDGETVVMVDPEAQVDAEAGSAYGCKRCTLPLGEAIDQLCTPTEEK
jgi:hypothetical protein